LAVIVRLHHEKKSRFSSLETYTAAMSGGNKETLPTCVSRKKQARNRILVAPAVEAG
jgi:hypothetical protein